MGLCQLHPSSPESPPRNLERVAARGRLLGERAFSAPREKRRTNSVRRFSKWPGTESNRRRVDFQFSPCFARVCVPCQASVRTPLGAELFAADSVARQLFALNSGQSCVQASSIRSVSTRVSNVAKCILATRPCRSLLSPNHATVRPRLIRQGVGTSRQQCLQIFALARKFSAHQGHSRSPRALPVAEARGVSGSTIRIFLAEAPLFGSSATSCVRNGKP
jgi:hypothetical protein